ncbi:recombinase family protein [Pseudomonas aeruginosa]|uniref:recombinase family protein n=1 Tax=Pseudomonas aeruginosa TaxID=287 RepID=UPI00109DA9C4|nr:recombinase family protein [Pseudomonas aeruginosa]EKV1239520.1 recombinase family protein [Pseudomonas aeruginosa]EKV8587814.1 recombinase family protein [Pseudomonas aeruginosa]ELN5409876.1 recombinase family protein [Pseudomonas aeruginosa]ELP1434988.1 recombinase family protein [Pseudomonas aeruginosa]THB19478.1 recombinase family protein [Pseudomonas aeruginosa]
MTSQQPTAYAYIRYSSRKQGLADKDSVDRQMNSIKAIAAQRGIQILPENVFSDTGVSGYTGKNQEKGKLKDLIDLILNQQVKQGDYVFVESIDRLSRQRMRLSKDLVYKILDRGVTLVTTIDGQVYSRDNDDVRQDIMLTVIAERAHEESKTKSVRRISAWKRAKEQAESTGKIFNAHRPPYGIRFNSESEKFEIDPIQAQEILDIFESLKLVGINQTIKKLNSYSERRWTQFHIRNLIDTKYPLGYFCSQRKVDGKMVFEKYIENYYPQIVPYDLWHEAVEAMKGRKTNNQAGRCTPDNYNVFRHIAVCGSCGEKMYFHQNFNAKTNSYYYLNCRSNLEVAGKCRQRFRYDFAFGILLQMVYQATTDEDFTPHPWQLLAPDEYKSGELMTTLEGGAEIHQMTDEQESEIERAENFRGILAQLLARKEAVGDKHRELTKAENEYRGHKIKLENYEKSLASGDGVISNTFMKLLATQEQLVADAEQKVNELKSVIIKSKTDITFYNYKDVIELNKSQEGRLKMNQFFLQNGITFRFKYDKPSRTLIARIYQGEHNVEIQAKEFPILNPLGEYNLKNLALYKDGEDVSEV